MRGIDDFPWSPEQHSLFPLSFRKATFTILCLNSILGFWTKDIVREIIKHLAVDWPWNSADVEHRKGKVDKAIETPNLNLEKFIENLAVVMELGFDKNESIEALRACDNNLEQAIDLLVAKT